MYIIGEHIHIIADRVKKALKEKDAKTFQEMAIAQVEAAVASRNARPAHQVSA